LQAHGPQRCGGTACRDQLEAESGEAFRYLDCFRFVVVVHADEDGAAFRKRAARADLGFQKASPKFIPTPITSPVERISGPRAGSTPGNLLNGIPAI
jgi:hypothetical protein